MPIPSGTYVIDLVTKTLRARRRNRFYYINGAGTPTPFSAGDMVKIANAVLEHFGPLMAELMSEDASVEKAEARYINTGGDEWEATSTIAEIEGTIPTSVGLGETGHDLLPDEVSLVCRVRTGQAGRAKRGRRFFTGLSEKINHDGEITDTTYKDAAKTLANALPGEITVEDFGESPTTITLSARHYSKFTGNLYPITQGQALSTLGTRRDRRQPLSMADVIP